MDLFTSLEEQNKQVPLAETVTETGCPFCPEGCRIHIASHGSLLLRATLHPEDVARCFKDGDAGTPASPSPEPYRGDMQTLRRALSPLLRHCRGAKGNLSGE